MTVTLTLHQKESIMQTLKIRRALLMALLAFTLSFVLPPAQAEAQQGNKYILYAEQGIWAAGKCRTSPDHYCRSDEPHLLTDAYVSTERKGLEAWGEIKGKTFNVKFISKLPSWARTWPVREDLVLDGETSQSLGFKKVIILKGDYAISRSGTVAMRVRAEK
jgi:hypothetical protein